MPYTRYLADFQNVVDAVMAETDHVERLKMMVELKRTADRVLVWARNEAAYEARSKWSGEDLQMATRVERKNIDEWSKHWRVARGLPRIPRRERKSPGDSQSISSG